MFKKRKPLILTGIALLSCLLCYTIAMGLDAPSELLSWFQLGREKTESLNDNQVVAKVNDIEILRSDLDHIIKMEKLKFEYQKQKYEEAKQSLGEDIHNTNIAPPQELDPDHILDRLIENEILYQEAKAQNLDISYEEAQKYANKMRKTQRQIMSGELTVSNIEEYYKIQEMTDQYIKGMDITENDYWDMAVPIYQKTLSIGNLKATIISSMRKDSNDKNPDKHFEEYIQNVKNQYKIQILNE